MMPTRVLGESLSLGPFLRIIKSLKGNESPEVIVDLALTCKAIIPNQTRSEIIKLLDLIQRSSCRYLMEIGTYRGGTLFTFSRVADAAATVISVDYPGTFIGHLYRLAQAPVLRRFASAGQSLFLLRKNSHDRRTLDSVRRILNGHELDFLFIDGDHSYEGVKQDFEMYKGLVKKGGFIAFHDICLRRRDSSIQVPRFWHELKSHFHFCEFIDSSAGHTAGIGVIWV